MSRRAAFAAALRRHGRTLLLAGIAAIVLGTYLAAEASRRIVDLVAITAVALAVPATSNLLGVGQWTGLNALGLAMAYRSWRHHAYASGGVWLAASAAIAKPHLALGLMVFALGWG